VPGKKTADNALVTKQGAAMILGQQWIVRYSFAMGTVGAAFLLYQWISRLAGGDLPTYITFYPAIMFVALLAGLGPGLVATIAAALLADYFIIPPQGFGIERLRDAAGLALFSGMGVFMTVVAELYRRARSRLEETVAERTAALSQANERLTQEIEDRWHADEALQASERKLQLFIEKAPAAIAMFDRDLRYIATSRRWITDYRLDDQDIVGRCHYDVFPEIPEHWKEVHRRCLAGATEKCDEDAFLRLDGTTDWIRWEVLPWYEAGGGIGGIIMATENITYRKKAEEALRESEVLLKRAQAIAHLGSWELDLLNDRLIWSDEVYRIFGLEPQEFGATYEAFLEAVHPDDRAAVDAAYSGSLSEGRDSYEIEHRVVRKSDGEIRIVHEKCEHFRDASGRIVRSVGMVHDITERKRAEEAQRESEARYRTLFENMLDGFAYCKMLFDDHGRPSDFVYLSVNNAFGKLTGLENVTGKKVTDVIPGIKESNPELFEIYGRVAVTGQPEKFVVEVKPLGIWFSVSAYSMEREYFVAVFDNITDRKRAEDALKESETRFSTVFHSSPVGIGIARLADGKFIDMNDAFLAIYGYTHEEAIGHTALELEMWDPIARESLVTELEKQGRVQNVEMKFRKKSGNTGDLLVSVELIELGDEMCILGLLTDITERKRAEEALLHSEQRFETLAAATFEGILISEHGRIIDANDQLARLVGYELNELIGLDVAAILPPEEQDRVLANIMAGRDIKLEHELVRKDGSRCFVETHGKTIRQQGRQIRLTAIHDITERKRYEEEFIQARQAAEAANRAKSQFLANISHELRTPMTGVLGMLELTLEEELAPKQRQYLETVQRSAEALLRLLNDILDFSRIEAGAITLAEEPFNLEWCVRSAMELLAIEAQRKGLELALEIAPGTPGVVEGDEGRVRQVLVNLIGNAIKFTDQGKVTIHIAKGEKAADRGHEITFAVTDTGIGIPEDKKELLFQTFSQVDASSTRRHGGTGLGLAISKGVVERMGGRISFASTENRGSTFFFTLPLREVVMPAAAGPPAGEAPVPQAGEAYGKLLLVEDDPKNRALLETVLRNRGYDIDLAGNGREAVALWEKGKYALVLMDVQMPQMDGFEATRLIRQMERERGGYTPIVALTAHAFPEDEATCIAAGMDAYVAKPIDFQQLYRVIADIAVKWTPPA
jgi:PAS domain S-box-containing protein